MLGGVVPSIFLFFLEELFSIPAKRCNSKMATDYTLKSF
jgi:hypothetical protein